ncbi:hypothetical protein OU997_03150 [Pseudomonas sp. SL4(2022)]|uniref:hypothetical protein n=1 Tax=Pseudomonas sp. SL4(2022) TaxID=2994661 RepID=UPI00227088AA|nr:hypothetical protein [Pseudomonas sp. SL4(2022)]WAC45205.1 hypothetical protein OU997_03150 [Pseudomonas sp. SL4(2022)]
MYLSTMAPEALSVVAELGWGLWVLRISRDDSTVEHVVVVKASKEVILTARENREFRFYLAPCQLGDSRGLTLLTAFFDDPENPLTITSPLIPGHPILMELQKLPNDFTICFFDDQNRELLSCRARARLDRFRETLLSSSYLEAAHWRLICAQAESWLANRTAKDDAQSFVVELQQDLFPSNCKIIEMNARHGFLGSSGFSSTSLERAEPGPLQEIDIIFLLQRVYAADRIVHGPLKVSDDEELVDVLILGKEMNVLLQAKDSPNTSKILNTTIDRKRRKSVSQLKDGLSQLGGALSTIRREGVVQLKIAATAGLEVNFSTKPCLGIVIVKELFPDKYDEYSSLALDFVGKQQMPIVFFDYPEFEVMTRHFPSEDALLSVFDQIFAYALNNHLYPRFRFTRP